MPPPPLIWDPEGLYARLGVDPQSRPDVITAAYRRLARQVHPDVPRTGDAEAFIALKRAYDVLSHADRRAAYDRSARFSRDHAETQTQTGRSHGPGYAPGQTSGPMRGQDWEASEIESTPHPELITPRTRHPRLRDLPVVVWAGMAVVVLVGVIEIGLHLRSPPSQTGREGIPATAASVPPLPANQPAPLAYGPAPVRLAGTPNFYIMPTASAAMLWRTDEINHTLVPWGQLPPFSAVQGMRLIKSNGMVEVKVTDTTTGFVEAGRLTPGDSAAAARAWCTFHAGPTPANGEVLRHAGDGQATLAVENQSGQPAVIKVRSPDGGLLSSVFLGPGGESNLTGLPEEPARVEFATGEVWSRACHGFEAGMRALRLPGLVKIGALARLTIPPDPAIATTDLSDQAFEQE